MPLPGRCWTIDLKAEIAVLRSRATQSRCSQKFLYPVLVFYFQAAVNAHINIGLHHGKVTVRQAESC